MTKGITGLFVFFHWSYSIHPFSRQAASSSQGLTYRDKRPSTPTGNLDWPINLASSFTCFWSLGGSRSTQREPMQTQGKHANPTQKRFWTLWMWSDSADHRITVPPNDGSPSSRSRTSNLRIGLDPFYEMGYWCAEALFYLTVYLTGRKEKKALYNHQPAVWP